MGARTLHPVRDARVSHAHGLGLFWPSSHRPGGTSHRLAAEPQTGPAYGRRCTENRDINRARRAKPGTKAVVPFEMLPTNHMLVEAQINGKGPYRLIFDLGAPITLLNNRASEASGVVKADAPRSFLFGMRGEAEIDKLQAGELTAAKLPVIVFDHPVLKALEDVTRPPDRRHHGLHALRPVQDDDRLPAQQMTFEPVDYEVRDLLKELPDRMLGPKVARAPGAGTFGRVGHPAGRADRRPQFDRACRVAAVVDGSPAEPGRPQAGDVITTLDGRWTASIADVYAAAADAEPGRATAVVIIRDGKEMTLSITPADGA